jgi:carbon monoxide dehydrogenase subunit G
MKISGKEKFQESSQVIWEALHTEKVLMHAIPGCQSFTLNDEDEYDISLKLGVAVIKGEYTGKACIKDIDEPTHFRLMASGCGKQGIVDMRINFTIESLKDGCQVVWECDAEIGGMIARVGNRAIGGIGRYLAENFFKDLQKPLHAKV